MCAHAARGSIALIALSAACSVEVAGAGPAVSLVDANAEPTGPVGSGKPPQDAELPALDGGAIQHDASYGPTLDAQPAVDPGCVLDGRYALHVSFDVSWVGSEFLNVIPVINPGQGELGFVVLVEMHETPAGLDARFRTCASAVPEFVSSLNEHYLARIDNAVWDSPSMPVFSAVLENSCDLPGCSVSGEPLVALIGAALSAPDAPWPTDPAGGSWPDHDADGEPGVAAYMAGPDQGSYMYPPVDIFGRRVRDLMLGLRVVVGMNGTLESCDELRGETPNSAIQTRAVNCQASTRPARCSASELSFLNDNLPVWTVRQGRFRALRLPPGAECKEARAMFARDLP